MSVNPRLVFVFLGLTALTACSDKLEPSLADEVGGRGPILMENGRCEVSGNPANWLAAYCMWMNNVSEYDRESDPMDDPVKKCISDVGRHPALPKTLCERNKYLKLQLCEALAGTPTFHGSVPSCLASSGTVPRVVREGL